MKKFILLISLFIGFALRMQAQTNVLIYSEDFETGAPGIALNDTGVGTNTGTNMWIINNNYTGTPTYPNTTDESVTSGGNISFAPHSKYLHIYDQPSGISSCNYNPTAASSRFVRITNGFCTLGLTNVKLTFFYLAQGSPTAYAEIYYSINNGPWTSAGTQYSSQTTWQYTIIQNPIFDNKNNVRFGIRWVNNAGSLPGAMSFGIDDIFLTGSFDNFTTNFNVIIDSIQPNPICQNFGMLIFYHLPVPICGNGFFEVQLSNSAGSFTTPTSLGIYMASNSNANGILWPTIPAATAPGSCYKIRIKYYFTDYALNFYSNATPCFEVQVCPNTITTQQPVVTMGGDSVCIGSVIDVPFYSTGVFLPGNNYIIQLSDSTGAFTGNMNILGSKPDTHTYDPLQGSPPGSVSGLINQNNQHIPNGCNYYIRVVSTNPVATGLQWGPFCIKHCDIETNHKLDIKACVNSTTGFDTTVYANIHYFDSSATAAVYNNPNNQFMLEVHSSQTFAVIPPVGGLGSIAASNDTTFHIHVPNATQLNTLGLSPGLYYVRIKATNSNHTWDANGTVIRLTIGAPADNLYIWQDPADSVLCVGDAVYFYPIPYNAGPPMNSTYQWYLNNAAWSTDAAIGILFNGAGVFNVSVRETNYGCPGPLTPNDVSLHVLAPPSPGLIGPIQVCKGDTAYYHITFHPDFYYEWNYSGGAMIDTSNNELYMRFDTAGVYTIDLLVLNKCGQTISHKNVIVYDYPNPTFTVIPPDICTGDSVTINYTGGSPTPLVFSWDLDGGSSSSGGNDPAQHATWSSPGQKWIILVVAAYSCHSKDTNFVNVTQTPIPAFTADSLCMDKPTYFTNNSQGNPASWVWNYGDGSPLDTTLNPSYTFPGSGSFNVTLKVTQGNCVDSLTKAISIEPCILPDLVVPNVFTPNGDGNNDLFKIDGLRYYPKSQLLVFSRWGNIVYKSDDYLNNWDGGNAADGVYYYILSLKNGKSFSGTVTIVR